MWRKPGCHGSAQWGGAAPCEYQWSTLPLPHYRPREPRHRPVLQRTALLAPREHQVPAFERSIHGGWHPKYGRTYLVTAIYHASYDSGSFNEVVSLG